MIIIGHRGAMGYEPENTLRSLKKALELGVDMIEFDVHLLKDGSVILMHDDTLERTTNGHGFVSEKTLKEIKKLDTGKGEKVPTLEEALDVIGRKVPVVIEMTGFLSSAKEISNILYDYVEHKGWNYDDFMISSFIHRELVKFRKLLPQVKIGANISGVPLTHALFAKEIGVDFLATENLYLNDDEFVNDAHKRGMQFFVFSLDKKEYLKRYEAFGIDGVFSNFPDRITSQ